jgi:hypothetical protein
VVRASLSNENTVPGHGGLDPRVQLLKHGTPMFHGAWSCRTGRGRIDGLCAIHRKRSERGGAAGVSLRNARRGNTVEGEFDGFTLLPVGGLFIYRAPSSSKCRH